MIIAIVGKLNSGKDTVANMIQYLENEDLYDYPYDEIEKDYIKSTWKIKKWADPMKDAVCMWLGCTRKDLESQEFKNTPLGEEWACWVVEYEYDHPGGFSEQWKRERIFLTKDEAIDWSEDNYLRGIVTKRWMTPRLMLQLLGTEFGRDLIHPNMWVNTLMSQYKGVCQVDYHNNAYAYMYCACEDNCQPENMVYPNWLITDTRFPNEVKAVRDRGGLVIKVKRHAKERHPELWHSFTHSEFYSWEEFLKEKGLYTKLYHSSETSLDNWQDWDYVIDNNGSMEDLIKKVRGVYDKITGVS